MKPATLLALCGLYATAAWFITAGMAKPDSRHVWPGFGGLYAYVEIRPTNEPGAVAEVYFENRSVHEGDEPFEITLDGLTVSVQLEWNVDRLGAERITVTPPDGYYAWPEAITVHENAEGVLYIYSQMLEAM